MYYHHYFTCEAQKQKDDDWWQQFPSYWDGFIRQISVSWIDGRTNESILEEFGIEKNSPNTEEVSNILVLQPCNTHMNTIFQGRIEELWIRKQDRPPISQKKTSSSKLAT